MIARYSCPSSRAASTISWIGVVPSRASVCECRSPRSARPQRGRRRVERASRAYSASSVVEVLDRLAPQHVRDDVRRARPDRGQVRQGRPSSPARPGGPGPAARRCAAALRNASLRYGLAWARSSRNAIRRSAATASACRSATPLTTPCGASCAASAWPRPPSSSASPWPSASAPPRRGLLAAGAARLLDAALQGREQVDDVAAAVAGTLLAGRHRAPRRVLAGGHLGLDQLPRGRRRTGPRTGTGRSPPRASRPATTPSRAPADAP